MEHSEFSEASEALFSQPLVKESSTYMSDSEAQKVCKLFADGLDAGLGYARIFDFMERQRLDKSMLKKLRTSVVELGDEIGAAFTRLGLLDAVSRKVLLVAEEQGELVQTFRVQARMFGERHRQRTQVCFAMVEPAFLFALAIVFFEIRKVILPAAMAKDMWDVLGPAFILGGLEGAMVLALISLLLYGWLKLPVDSAFRDSMTRGMLYIPVVSIPSRYRAVANFTRYLSQSLRAGMDIVRSIELAAEAANSGRFTKYIDPVTEALEAGYSLESALSAMKGVPIEVRDFIGIGEETGKLEENLDFLTEKYDALATENFSRMISALLNITRLAAIVIILVFVVFGGVLDMITIDL